MDTINVTERETTLTPRDLRAARGKNQIPAAIYGKSVESKSIFIKAPLKHVESWKRGKHFKVKIDGQTMRATVDEVQRDPVKRTPVHVSLHAVSANEEMKVEVPITLKGEAKGHKQGGVTTQTKKFILLKGQFKDLPEELEVDVTNLDVNEHIEVKDLNLPNGVETLEDNPNQNVIVCSFSNVSLETDTEQVMPEETETTGTAADEIAS
ncbi:MAG: 50S ribosomal protein L25 [Halobacteriovoraceae bacterium]|nr:50S ribosomal protein L25 [Halobacteriovoraceae bacterium]|tara:strand:- start:116191 stop:116817 length:627 start_codon:yes stop_codon:yes gene_type:complete